MKYFKEEEFIMGSVCVYDKMDKDFLVKLDLLRELLDSPVKINSSYRSEEYNKNIGGSLKSMHLTGKAADISIVSYDGATRCKLVNIALSLGLSVGVAKTFIHIDNREVQTLFGY